MLPWTASLRSRARAVLPGARGKSRLQKPPPVSSPTVTASDFALGPIPTEPQCYPKGFTRNDTIRIRSAVLDPSAIEPVADSPDRRHLRFRSLKEAKQRLDTVIHLIGASKYLTPADFKRILPTGKHIPQWRSDGGLLKIVPVRNPSTMERLDQWLLAFSSPWHAALYHSRLLWYHQNAKINAPIPPADLAAQLSLQKSNRREGPYNRYIPPALGAIDESSGEDLAYRVREYTIFQQGQHALVEIAIPPFPDFYLHNLWLYDQWNKPDSYNRVTYPVMFYLDPPQEWFQTKLLRDFITNDGKDRGIPWKVWDSEAAVMRLIWATYESGSPDDRIEYEIEMGPTGTLPKSHSIRMDRDRFMIRFQDENDAKRFIRRWNCVHWDDDPGGKFSGYVSPIIKADQLW